MPKVTGLTTEQRFIDKSSDLAMQCEFLLLRNHISKLTIAEFLHISPPAVYQQFKRERITIDVFMAVCTLCNVPDDEIGRMVRA